MAIQEDIQVLVVLADTTRTTVDIMDLVVTVAEVILESITELVWDIPGWEVVILVWQVVTLVWEVVTLVLEVVTLVLEVATLR